MANDQYNDNMIGGRIDSLWFERKCVFEYTEELYWNLSYGSLQILQYSYCRWTYKIVGNVATAQKLMILSSIHTTCEIHTSIKDAIWYCNRYHEKHNLGKFSKYFMNW